MFCPKCGMENIDNSKFCNKCGENLIGWNLNEKTSAVKSWEVWKKPGDMVELFCSIILIFSLFMPFISVTVFGSKMSVRMIERDGKILLVMTIIAILGLFFQGSIVIDLLGALDALFTVALSFYEIYHAEMLIREKSYGTYDLSGLYNRENGYYLLIVGAIGVVVGLLLRAVIGNSKKTSTTTTIMDQSISKTNLQKNIPVKKCDICGKTYALNLEECPSCKWRRSFKMIIAKIKPRLPIIISAVIILAISITGLSVYFAKYHLNSEEKNLVNSTIAAINELDTIDLDSKEKIENAEQLYASLSPKCLRFVENGDTIQEARSSYDELCAQNVMGEITAIGEVTLEKKEEIERVKEHYEQLTEDQRSLVSNKEILDDAAKQIENIEEALIEAKEVVELFAEGIVNRDTYQIKQTISDEVMGKEAQEVLDAFSMFYSPDLWAQYIAELLFDGQIQYYDFDYFGRQTLDQMGEAIVEAILITRYEIENVRYVDGKVLVDVKLFMKNGFDEANIDLGDMMREDMENYIEANKSWLSYSMYGKSNLDIAKEVFNLVAMSNGDKWVREIKKLSNGVEVSGETFTVQVENINGEWKITNLE